MKYLKRTVVVVLFVPACLAAIFIQSWLEYIIRGKVGAPIVDKLLKWAEK